MKYASQLNLYRSSFAAENRPKVYGCELPQSCNLSLMSSLSSMLGFRSFNPFLWDCNESPNDQIGECSTFNFLMAVTIHISACRKLV